MGGKFLRYHKYPSILDSPDWKHFFVVVCVSHLQSVSNWSRNDQLDGFLTKKKCPLLLPQTSSWPIAAFEAQGCSGPWEWLWSLSVSHQGPDLQTLLVALCGISAELGFPKQTRVSHLMDLLRVGEVQSHCIFLNFKFLAEDISAREMLLPKEEDPYPPKTCTYTSNHAQPRWFSTYIHFCSWGLAP